MGEYAVRKSDREEIKIGTCESMYYLRYSDREKVRAKEGNVDPNDDSTIKELLWRLPFPDEDHIQPGGNYKEYTRGAELSYDFTNPDNAEYPGILQLHSKTGLLVNIACYHGEKKPTDTKEVQFHWNGKAPSYNLTALKFRDDGVYGIYSCTECGHAWRRPLKEIIPFMIRYEDQDLVKRLIEWYCPEMSIKKESVPA
jgi:DNA-directed RNA polymerase subunit M/transcription elongation factor TFIIS